MLRIIKETQRWRRTLRSSRQRAIWSISKTLRVLSIKIFRFTVYVTFSIDNRSYVSMKRNAEDVQAERQIQEDEYDPFADRPSAPLTSYVFISFPRLSLIKSFLKTHAILHIKLISELVICDEKINFLKNFLLKFKGMEYMSCIIYNFFCTCCTTNCAV